MEKVDELRWPRKVKAAEVEGQQRKGRRRFGWLDGVKRVVAFQGVRLAGGNATRERKECVERTREVVIVLMQF